MSQNSSFNPNEHLMKLGRGDNAKDYLAVQWRLVWFREQCPSGTIDTEEMEVDLDREITTEVSVWNKEKRCLEKILKTAKGYARFKASVFDGKGGRATGHGSESAVDFPDFLEKAETKAVGRALAALGYGTQFTGDAFNEGHRIVDSPVNHTEDTSTNTHPSPNVPPPPASDQQITSIRKVCQALKKREPENLKTITYSEAKQLMIKLAAEYREHQQKAS